MHIAQNWRLNKQRYMLVGVRFDDSQHIVFPPREVDPQRHEEAAPVEARLKHFPEFTLSEAVDLQKAGR